MIDTVKLIVEIPKNAKQAFDKAESNDFKCSYYDNGGIIGKAIQNGIPLDSNSERAEVQAYFAGQTYGWEQGRKALIEEIVAKVNEIPTYERDGYWVMADVWKVLNSIENEVKNDKISD